MARYDEMKSRWLLPEMMRADTFDDAMSGVVDVFGADVSAATRDFSVWNAIDDMDEAAIDALAEELNILWYDKQASLDSKRNAIRNCKRIQAKLGTKWAIEEIMKIYFSADTKIVEWFEYSGEEGDPNHFRIVTDAVPETTADTERFMAVLNQVKRKSAILDKIVGVISSETAQEVASWGQSLAVSRIEVGR